ncbi:TPM domain-containing protein [Floricoccus penangensis]|uniref:TPM domain-containing protein n=1 Tax=Floricoccus penangensis TaxID=1859475 RepID=UPI00203EF5C1|nr:TPM domain-containing protein [Floricoccus penangensis]URZ87573.1 TPM domain-containing protein [Floricoccus penangensis]
MKKKLKYIVLILFFLIAMFGIGSIANGFKRTVIDKNGFLSTETINEVKDLNKEFSSWQTKPKLYIEVVQHLPKNTSSGSFTYKLLKKKHNRFSLYQTSMVFVISVEDREYSLKVSKDLENIVDSSSEEKIITKNVIEDFSKDDWNSAMSSILNNIEVYGLENFNTAEKLTAGNSGHNVFLRRLKDFDFSIILYLPFILLFVFIVITTLTGDKKEKELEEKKKLRAEKLGFDLKKSHYFYNDDLKKVSLGTLNKALTYSLSKINSKWWEATDSEILQAMKDFEIPDLYGGIRDGRKWGDIVKDIVWEKYYKNENNFKYLMIKNDLESLDKESLIEEINSHFMAEYDEYDKFNKIYENNIFLVNNAINAFMSNFNDEQLKEYFDVLDIDVKYIDEKGYSNDVAVEEKKKLMDKRDVLLNKLMINMLISSFPVYKDLSEVPNIFSEDKISVAYKNALEICSKIPNNLLEKALRDCLKIEVNNNDLSNFDYNKPVFLYNMSKILLPKKTFMNYVVFSSKYIEEENFESFRKTYEDFILDHTPSSDNGNSYFESSSSGGSSSSDGGGGFSGSF